MSPNAHGKGKKCENRWKKRHNSKIAKNQPADLNIGWFLKRFHLLFLESYWFPRKKKNYHGKQRQSAISEHWASFHDIGCFLKRFHLVFLEPTWFPRKKKNLLWKRAISEQVFMIFGHRQNHQNQTFKRPCQPKNHDLKKKTHIVQFFLLFSRRLWRTFLRNTLYIISKQGYKQG